MYRYISAISPKLISEFTALMLLILCMLCSLVNGDEEISPYICKPSLVGKTRLVYAKINDTYEMSLKESMTGRVEVCLSAPPSFGIDAYFWGTVCSRRINLDSLNAICSSLHYNNIAKIGFQYRPQEVAADFESAMPDQPTFMNNLDCSEADVSDMTKCNYDIENTGEDECGHLTDTYIECTDRIQCNVCLEEESCNFDLISYQTERCSASEIYCVRQVTTFGDGAVIDVMGCSEKSCEEHFESCQDGAQCLCNDCVGNNCNLLFLELLEINIDLLGTSMVESFGYLMEMTNFFMRLILFDITAWMSLL